MKRRSVHELMKTPSHLYQRLLLGEISSWEYVRVVKRSVDRKLGR